VKILILDTDDNKPVFTKDNITIGKSYSVNSAITDAIWLNCFDLLLKKKKLIIIILFSIGSIETFYRYYKTIHCPNTAKNKAI
jgi:hypothetical protein